MKKKGTVLVILLFLLFNLSCSKNLVPTKIEGNAMLPAFKNGDLVLFDGNVNEIKRGDVISFKYPKDVTKRYFKRVIGLPGETVTIRDGHVFINDQELDEQYVDQTYNQSKNNFPPIRVEEGNYYVLGDNRDNSSDSRYWGTVKSDLIIGKYHMTYWHSE